MVGADAAGYSLSSTPSGKDACTERKGRTDIKVSQKKRKKNNTHILLIALALTLGIGLMGPAWATLWDHSLTQVITVNTGHMTQSGDVVFSQVDPGGDIMSLDAKSAHRISLKIEGVKSAGDYSVTSQLLNQASTIPVCFITGKPELIENNHPDIIDIQFELSDPKAMVGGDGLDIGDKEDGLIKIIVLDDTIPDTYPFKITIPCVQYNANDVNPGEWNDIMQIEGTVEILPKDPLDEKK